MACILGRVLWWWDGISFRVVLSKSFWLWVLPGGARLVQPRWTPERRILGGNQTGGVSFWPFLNFSGWRRLISSVFLTRISCLKTAHANGYYGAWPGWAVSASVLPLTISFRDSTGLKYWLIFFGSWIVLLWMQHMAKTRPIGGIGLENGRNFPLRW